MPHQPPAKPKFVFVKLKLLLDISCVAILFLKTDAAAPADVLRHEHLFFIAKNTNNNEVHYEVRVTQDCQFAELPLRVHWMRREESLLHTRDLRWIEEKFAYGVEIHLQSDGRLRFTIAADKTRPIVVELKKIDGVCRALAQTKILDQWVRPRFAFVHLKERKALYPKINHIDLRGMDTAGQPLCERVFEAGQPGIPCPLDN